MLLLLVVVMAGEPAMAVLKINSSKWNSFHVSQHHPNHALKMSKTKILFLSDALLCMYSHFLCPIPSWRRKKGYLYDKLSRSPGGDAGAVASAARADG